ncbi:protein RESTRICTED TEV MOVEMENT 3 [Primulina huaijiensis]|uniref:protein RESTRICTED TEV MOVEMENT 3 n=1 Tax=Primulina huaijiensis TaxID=1492673 RepID=UPI003CC73F51
MNFSSIQLKPSIPVNEFAELLHIKLSFNSIWYFKVQMASDLDQDGVVTRMVSDVPPTHYITKINMFSQLSKNNIDKYTSSHFHAGGYKWKLAIHPNGNKNKGITDHISFYLEIVEVDSLCPGWEIRATFRLYILDQKNDNYLILQDAEERGRRFHGMKLEWGYDKFISQDTFKDPENGYLANDTSIFGAEVYIRQEKHTGKGECLSMIKDAIGYKNTWRIENYSGLKEECIDSQVFIAADKKWKIQLYPKGKGSGTGSYISLYLTLAEPENLTPTSKIYADFTLRILDQISGNHYFGKATYWFSASNTTCGWPRFVSHAYFSVSSVGLLVKNVCLVDAELTVHGIAKPL